MSDELVKTEPTEPSRSLRAAEFRLHQQCKPSPTDAINGAEVNNHRHMPARSEITDDTPLRLAVAAALAYPDGSMTASGLRREAARGRLVIERTAGKDYTTLRYIEHMRALCRVPGKDRASGCAPKSEIKTARSVNVQFGSSETDRARSARAALQKIARAPSVPSASTLPTNTGPAVFAAVIPQERRTGPVGSRGESPMTPLTVLDKVVEALQAAGATEEMIAGEFRIPQRAKWAAKKRRQRAAAVLRDAARPPPNSVPRDETPLPDPRNLRVRIIDASNGNVDALSDIAPIRVLLDQGCDLEADVLAFGAFGAAEGAPPCPKTRPKGGRPRKYADNNARKLAWKRAATKPATKPGDGDETGDETSVGDKDETKYEFLRSVADAETRYEFLRSVADAETRLD
jgi:hypothetical protein